jgi:VanZ family protein
MTELIKRLSGPKTLFLIGVLYSVCITIALLSPTNNVPRIDIAFLDKAIHIVIHLLLSFIWLWYGFTTDKYHISFKLVFLTLSMCFAYGLAIEAMQHWFTQTRTFDVFDLVANVLGSLLGLFFFWIFKRRIVH